MTYKEYIEQNGPSLSQLANMSADERRFMAKMTYQEWFASSQEDTDDFTAAMEWAGVDFEAGYDLATEIMAYMHMAQDARALSEKQG